MNNIFSNILIAIMKMTFTTFIYNQQSLIGRMHFDIIFAFTTATNPIFTQFEVSLGMLL